MVILIAHNDYGKYSGEEAVVDKMSTIFSSLGHSVAQLRRSTANARQSLRGKISVFTSGIYAPSGIKAMRNAIRQHHPDIVNIHNLYPFISPAALRECKKAGIPVVMTIHNFRLICPTGLFMRNGAPCEQCLTRGNELPCITYNCEHSILKSTAYAARNAVARINRHYLDCVDRFACITDFQRRKLIEAGFPRDKIVVIPNSMDLPDRIAPSQPTEAGSQYVGFCGRISREKGIDLIIDVARRHPEIPFRLAGAVGDPELIANLPDNISLTGYLSGDALANFYRDARFMVMASRCYEGFPMTTLEAAKYGKPTIGPNHGGFPEIILADNSDDTQTSELLFTPGSVDDLDRAITSLWSDMAHCAKLGASAHSKLRSNYSTPVIAAQWQDLLSQLYKK